jgi:septal ring factor EnvC (AmiA/AmiB activator)
MAVAADDNRLKVQQHRLETVRSQIKTLQEELERKIGRHSKLEQQLGEIEKQLDRQHRELRSLQRQLQSSQAELKKLHGRQSALHSQMETQQNRLVSQIRTAYFIGSQEQLKILLSQQDPSALARTLKYFEYLNRARLQAISEHRDTLREVEATQRQIERQSSRLATLTGSRETEYQEMDKLRGERRVVLSSLKDEIQSGKSSVVSLRRNETQIRELISTLTGIFSDIPPETNGLAFFEQKGLLPWPVQGKHQNRFGEARSGSDLSWRGIQITAPGGHEVRAISHGRVAFADWIPVLGLILLIDHSDGYISLYAHNQSLYKETGDWVQAGEVVANVGNSGGSQTDSLYFEIRHNGKPLNPTEWCRQTDLNRNT